MQHKQIRFSARSWNFSQLKIVHYCVVADTFFFLSSTSINFLNSCQGKYVHNIYYVFYYIDIENILTKFPSVLGRWLRSLSFWIATVYRIISYEFREPERIQHSSSVLHSRRRSCYGILQSTTDQVITIKDVVYSNYWLMDSVYEKRR